jgi:hypothetical protein
MDKPATIAAFPFMAHAAVEMHEPRLAPTAPPTEGLIVLATMPLPRPPHIAEREELDAALALGTRAAIEHFIERHPRSRYRPEAEAALARLTGQPSPR